MNNENIGTPVVTFPKLSAGGVQGADFGGHMVSKAGRYGVALDGQVVINLIRTRRPHRGQAARWEAFDAVTFAPLPPRARRVTTLKDLKAQVVTYLTSQVVGF